MKIKWLEKMENYFEKNFISFILWENFEGKSIQYCDWDESMKSELNDYITKLSEGLLSFNLPIDPPQSKSFNHVVTCIDPDLAKSYYLAFLALSLYNSKNFKQYSLNQLSDNDKKLILDSRSLFVARKFDGGYFIASDVIGCVSPSDPMIIMRFLLEESILGIDHRVTIINLLNWCKILSHYSGSSTKENYLDHWNYDGFPSVGSVINGTLKKSDFSQIIRHYTAGCHGTVGVICLILKVINIPVKKAEAANHSQAIFNSINSFLSHGDDPYNRDINKPEIDYKSILIDLSIYDDWYIKNINPIDYVGYGVSIVKSHNNIQN